MANVREKCIENFKQYAREVSVSNSLKKRCRPQPIVISKKDQELSQDITSMTKDQLKRKIENCKMDEVTQREWTKIKKGKKRGIGQL